MTGILVAVVIWMFDKRINRIEHRKEEPLAVPDQKMGAVKTSATGSELMPTTIIIFNHLQKPK
jgi:hypothetical protein